MPLGGASEKLVFLISAYSASPLVKVLCINHFTIFCHPENKLAIDPKTWKVIAKPVSQPKLIIFCFYQVQLPHSDGVISPPISLIFEDAR